jgi:hypothetical protein
MKQDVPLEDVLSAAIRGYVAPKDADRHVKTVARRLPEVPRCYRQLYLKVVSGQGTRSQCIKAHCLECVGWDKKEVAHCASTACGLYRFRPFKAPVSGTVQAMASALL